MDILLKSVFVGFNPDFDVSISTMVNRISRLAGQTVSRVDDIHGTNGHQCIVHFDQDMSEALWDMLSADEKTIIGTSEGPICIGLNHSNGLDPNTEDDITQFILNDVGLYLRKFRTGVVRKWNREYWVDTTENPFVTAVKSLSKNCTKMEALV